LDPGHSESRPGHEHRSPVTPGQRLDENASSSYKGQTAPKEPEGAAQVAVQSSQFLSFSIGQAIQEASAHLRPASDHPRVEAEILLGHVLQRTYAALLTHPEQGLSPAQLAEYRALVRDRALGHPLPHLTGRVEFYGLEIEVTPEVLIPRHETELLVELALDRHPRTAVDVGTGSGCIAVALATQLPDLEAYAIDISPAALAVARRNAERHGVEQRIQFIVGDLLDRRPAPVDLIVSNPPYVSADDWATLPREVRCHEPRLALDGGPDGFALIRRLLAQSEGLLEAGGTLLVEIGAGQGTEAQNIARIVFPGDMASIRIHTDLAGRDRVLEVQL